MHNYTEYEHQQYIHRSGDTSDTFHNWILKVQPLWRHSVIFSPLQDIRNDLKLFFWCCFHLSKFVWKTWLNWHSGITTWRQADATLQQSLVLCLENRVQTTENLMKMTLGEWIGWFWAMNGGTGWRSLPDKVACGSKFNAIRTHVDDVYHQSTELLEVSNVQHVRTVWTYFKPNRKLALRSLTFAPVEIFMIRGLVASILGFWPGAPEAMRMDAWHCNKNVKNSSKHYKTMKDLYYYYCIIVWYIVILCMWFWCKSWNASWGLEM